MAVIKEVELIGTSSERWEDAVRQVIKQAYDSLRHVRGVDVVHQRTQVKPDCANEYRATLNVAFLLEHPSHILGPALAEHR